MDRLRLEEERELLKDGSYRTHLVRTVTIFDGSEPVGRIRSESDENGKFYSADRGRPYEVSYVERDYNSRKRHSTIKWACSVAEGKQIFSAWYMQNRARTIHNSVRALPEAPDNEFFPTPPALAGRMVAHVRWNTVNTILEPSAGKGDLALYALKCAKSRRRHIDEHWNSAIDCMELDPNLRLLLQGKGLRVVADDFLKAHPFKAYDVIIMNPPFSNGDEHLLKAIQMQENGGQIVCLLNAETLKNPYTNRRRLLVARLREYGAKIEYIQGAFRRAERKSDVEVAIVYLDIPRKEERSYIVEGLKQAKPEAEEYGDPSAIVSANWIERLIAECDFECRAGLALMREYNGIAKYIKDDSSVYGAPLIVLSVQNETMATAGSNAVNKYLQGVRGKYWKKLLMQKELTDRMTQDMQSAYSKRIQELSDYDFDEFNVKRFILEISAQLNSGVEESIEKLFDEMSKKYAYYPECENNVHYYNGWATNKAHKIGMKVIMPINGYSSVWDKKKLNGRQIGAKMADIERALSYLEKGETICRLDPYAVADAAESGGKTRMEFTYFNAIFYKKGTCHIKFKTEAAAIIDRMNIYAARKRAWLPPDYGKKRYDDMDDKARAVIDEFQGKKAYDEVMRAPEKYIIQPAAALPMLTA